MGTAARSAEHTRPLGTPCPGGALARARLRRHHFVILTPACLRCVPNPTPCTPCPLHVRSHGFHLGEFRMPYFKAQPYDTDINVPMMVRGPGVRAGATIDQIGLNIDVGPTIAELVGTKPPAEAKVDGVSLVPLLLSRSDDELAAAAAGWRRDFMFEFWGGADLRNATHFPPGVVAIGGYCHRAICSWNNTYAGVRTADDLKYVEFRDLVNFTEYYNVSRDPYELRNAVADAEPQAQQAVARLRTRLAQLRHCSGEECH